MFKGKEKRVRDSVLYLIHVSLFLVLLLPVSRAEFRPGTVSLHLEGFPLLFLQLGSATLSLKSQASEASWACS